MSVIHPRHCVAFALVLAQQLLCNGEARAFNVLTDINDMHRADLQTAGSLDIGKAIALRTDGTWTLGLVNTDLSDWEMIQLHQTLGPGWVVAEDDCNVVTNFKSVRGFPGHPGMAGYVNDYMTYWPEMGEQCQSNGFVTLSYDGVSGVLSNLSTNASDGVIPSQVTVNVRHYVDASEVQRVDERLNDSRVSGITIEMEPDTNQYSIWHIGDLIKNALDHGKTVYLLMPPKTCGNGGSGIDYLKALKAYVNAIRLTGRLGDSRLYLVPAWYGSCGTTWFGTTNSVESAISFLKEQPEYHSEWAVASAQASSTVGGWPTSNLLDNNSFTQWSSVGSAVQNTTQWLASWWAGLRSVNYVRLRPRWNASTNAVYGFPVDMAVYYSNGASWVQSTVLSNIPVPAVDESITIPFPSPVSANGIDLVATKLGPDQYANYYFQLADLSAGLARRTKLRNVGTAKCMTSPSGSDGATLSASTCGSAGQANQAMDMVPRGGYFHLVGQNGGKCVSIHNGSLSDGASVRQYTCDAATSKLFALEAIGSGHRLRALHSGKCLTVVPSGGSYTLAQYTCYSDTSGLLNQQLWTNPGP